METICNHLGHTMQEQEQCEEKYRKSESIQSRRPTTAHIVTLLCDLDGMVKKLYDEVNILYLLENKRNLISHIVRY